MENPDDILDSGNIVEQSAIDPQYIISTSKFIVLTIVSFGLYPIWWVYKVWLFFKQRNKMDIMPVARAIFAIFFVHALFTEILQFAKKKGYDKIYDPGWLAVGYIILSLLSRLPEPFWMISLVSFVFMLPSFNALNYAKEQSTDFTVHQQESFNGKQIAVIVVGLLLWVLVIIGLNA
jgi:hypothetical protein